MNLLILDPNLDGYGGHHYSYDIALGEDCVRRGASVQVYCHERFQSEDVGGVSFTPFFRTTTYQHFLPFKDNATWQYRNTLIGNQQYYKQLKQIDLTMLNANQIVLVPTIDETQLLGFVRWVNQVSDIVDSVFVVFLMLPTGLDYSRGKVINSNPIRSLFYQLAFDELKDKTSVKFLASSEEHAEQYSTFLGRPMSYHPVVLDKQDTGRTEPSASNKVVLYCGDAKLDKGFDLLVESTEDICNAFPHVSFWAHADPTLKVDKITELSAKMVELSISIPNFNYLEGQISNAQYKDLFKETAVVVLPYDASAYSSKSSGILWDSISAGTTMVLPAMTWLEREALKYSASHVCFYKSSQKQLFGAIKSAIELSETELHLRKSSMQKFNSENGTQKVIDKIFNYVVTQDIISAQESVEVDETTPIDTVSETSGWYALEELNKRLVRWTGREFSFLRPDKSRFCLLAGPRSFSMDIFGDIEIYVDDEPVPADVEIGENGAWKLLIDIGDQLGTMLKVSLNRLLETYDGENRELGLLVSDIKFYNSFPSHLNLVHEDNDYGSLPLSQGARLGAKNSAGEFVYHVGPQFALDAYFSGEKDLKLQIKLSSETTAGLSESLRMRVNGNSVSLETLNTPDGDTLITGIIAKKHMSPFSYTRISFETQKSSPSDVMIIYPPEVLGV